VRIVRDEYGVPHIYADDLGALFFSFGHAIAQDRLFQLEMTRRTSWGTVSEVLGPDFLDLDRNMRRVGYTRQQIREQLARLAPEYRTMLTAYADGVNDIIDSIAKGQTPLPADFARAGERPPRWTEDDVAQLFVAFMATRYSDGTGQVESRDAAWIEGLRARFGPDKARVIFDDLILDREDPGSIPTIPRGENWREKGVPVKERRAANAAPRPKSGIVPPGVPEVAARMAAAESADASRIKGLGVPSGLGSYGWVVGSSRTLNGSAILLGGPQMGFYSPGYLYEVGLHGAGFDVVGSTPIGHLPILFGHNASAAWTATAGYGDSVDLFVETLDPTDPTRYRFKGEWRRMDSREEVFKVKGGADVKETVYRTVHGPLESVDLKNGFAYARARGFAGLELESMAGWIDKTRAETYEAFVAAARRNALSISWLYADRKGNIGFAFCGRYPLRHPDQDRRLPTPGTGEREWLGFVPPEEMPHVVNPARGFLVNWNNLPAGGWFNPGIFSGKVHGSQRIIDFFESKGVITLEDVKASVRLGAYHVTEVDYFRPRLLEAVRQVPAGDADLQRAAEALAKWDGNSVDLDGDEKYDSPGFTVFDTWFRQMLADTFTEATVGPVSGTLQQQGKSLLLRVLDGDRALLPLKGRYLGDRTPEQAMIAALRKTVDSLRRTYGPVPEKWLLPARPGGFEFRNYLGVPQGTRARPLSSVVKAEEGNWHLERPQGFEKRMTFPPMRRGTENHFVVLSEKGVIGLNVVAPGVSGIAPEPGKPSPHFADQIDLLLNFEYKPMRFLKKDVDAVATSTERLSYSPRPRPLVP
ncbi:MAG: penicillin acylase family protein, partial [Acidobacteria bacterium]|nr:penicillin acylase family protein [Acidobacteriota bacterium]